jgi:hypothetical protein
VSDAQASTPVAQKCETLLLLFKGPSGTARVGRLLGGAEAGRTVLLREVAGLPDDQLIAEIGAVSMLAHPSLLKVLGLARSRKTQHIASEFIAGASLLQVEQARSRESPLELSVCLKIVYDALVAASIAKRVFEDAGRVPARRMIFSDTVWIAEFGQTLLTEAGISHRLHGREGAGLGSSDSESGVDPDVLAAGTELRRLVLDQTGNLTLPAAHQNAVMSMLERSEGPAANRFSSVEEMVRALEALPAGSIATEDEVGDVIRNLMRLELQRQHSHVNIRPPGELDEPIEGATKVFSPHQLGERFNRVTERPPSFQGRSERPLESEPPEPAAELSEDLKGESRWEETQIFIPVFSTEGRGPTGVQRRGRGAPVASVPFFEQSRTQAMAVSAEVRAPGRPRRRAIGWFGALVLLVALAALVVLLLGMT